MLDTRTQISQCNVHQPIKNTKKTALPLRFTPKTVLTVEYR